jgi:hypothetical protein
LSLYFSVIWLKSNKILDLLSIIHNALLSGNSKGHVFANAKQVPLGSEGQRDKTILVAFCIADMHPHSRGINIPYLQV